MGTVAGALIVATGVFDRGTAALEVRTVVLLLLPVLPLKATCLRSSLLELKSRSKALISPTGSILTLGTLYSSSARRAAKFTGPGAGDAAALSKLLALSLLVLEGGVKALGSGPFEPGLQTLVFDATLCVPLLAVVPRYPEGGVEVVNLGGGRLE